MCSDSALDPMVGRREIRPAPVAWGWTPRRNQQIGSVMTQTTSAPTVVLVHGAFADASGWAGVLRELQSTGLTVLAPPNPLRQLSGDADAVAAFVGAID